MERYRITTVTFVLGLAVTAAIAVGDEPKTVSHPDDPAARAFLKQAEEQSPSWNGFPGFSAAIKVYFDGKTHEGRVETGANRRVKVSLSDPEARKWVAETLAQSLNNVNRKPFEERYAGMGIVFGKDDLHPLGQLIEVHGDPYQSRFRIKDGEFRTIRRMTKTHEVAIHVINIDRDEQGRKRSRSFVVNYFDKHSGKLDRSEAIREERILLGGYPLPAVWVESDLRRGRNATRTLTLTGHKLLPAAEERTVSSQR